jgi:hypothetical protein
LVLRGVSGDFYTETIGVYSGIRFNYLATGTILNFYFNGSTLASFSGDTGTINGTGSIELNVIYSRIGDIVVVTIPATSFTASGGLGVLTATNVIPNSLVPTQGIATTVFAPQIGITGSNAVYDSDVLGTIQIIPPVVLPGSSDIVIRRTAFGSGPPTTWQDGSNQGFDSTSITYCRIG